MPKVELTMNQWGLVLQAVRATLLSRLEDNSTTSLMDVQQFVVIEGKIIDMAFDDALRKRGE